MITPQNKRTRTALPSVTAATTIKSITVLSAKFFSDVIPPALIDRDVAKLLLFEHRNSAGTFAAAINEGLESSKLKSYISAALVSIDGVKCRAGYSLRAAAERSCGVAFVSFYGELYLPPIDRLFKRRH